MLAPYLVMKNNLKRCFQNKTTYLLIFMIPLLISIVGMLSINIKEGNVKIGVEDASLKPNFEHVTLVEINKDTIHTDYIMGKFEYILKGDEEEDTQNVQMLIDKKANNSGLTGEKQLIAMLVTAYLVIATMYASKQIADQSNKTVERYCYAGNKMRSYMLGTFYSTAIIVFLEIMVALLLFYFLIPERTYSFVQVLGLGIRITVITSFFAAILSRFAHSEMSANMIAAFFAVFSSIIGGTFVAVNAMPKFLQILSMISPIRWILF